MSTAPSSPPFARQDSFDGFWRAARRAGSGCLLVLLVVALIIFTGVSNAESESESDSDWPDWPELDLSERVDAVSDGELRMLTDGPVSGAHMHQNRIHILPSSLDDGWVRLEQCHEQLDPVPAAQVTYAATRIRNIRITESRHIGRAWVEGATVQLQDIQPQARLCVTADSLALLDLGAGYYRLRTGPYMRRFLDGYYPMRLLLDIGYPDDILDFIRTTPPEQPGFELTSEPARLRIDVSFEGRLYSCVDFAAQGADIIGSPKLACSGD